MLSAVDGEQRLSNSWHVFTFAYGNPSTLIVRDHGHVAGSISSERGVKQGCVLGSLGFARHGIIFSVFQELSSAMD